MFSQQYTLDADLHSPWFVEARDRYGRSDERSLERCKKLREIAFNTTHVNKPDPETLTAQYMDPAPHTCNPPTKAGIMHPPPFIWILSAGFATGIAYTVLRVSGVVRPG